MPGFPLGSIWPCHLEGHSPSLAAGFQTWTHTQTYMYPFKSRGIRYSSPGASCSLTTFHWDIYRPMEVTQSMSRVHPCVWPHLLTSEADWMLVCDHNCVQTLIILVYKQALLLVTQKHRLALQSLQTLHTHAHEKSHSLKKTARIYWENRLWWWSIQHGQVRALCK